jgi:hypothetical protein
MKKIYVKIFITNSINFSSYDIRLSFCFQNEYCLGYIWENIFASAIFEFELLDYADKQQQV